MKIVICCSPNLGQSDGQTDYSTSPSLDLPSETTATFPKHNLHQSIYFHLLSVSSKSLLPHGSLMIPGFLLRRLLLAAFPGFHFIILKSPRMQSDTRSWLISKPLILFSFEENNMDGSKQGIIGQTHGSAWPANNPDPLPRLAASLGNIVH